MNDLYDSLILLAQLFFLVYKRLPHKYYLCNFLRQPYFVFTDIFYTVYLRFPLERPLLPLELRLLPPLLLLLPPKEPDDELLLGAE